MPEDLHIINVKKSIKVCQLRAVLGLLNYYRKFMPNAATVLHPRMPCYSMKTIGIDQQNASQCLRKPRSLNDGQQC